MLKGFETESPKSVNSFICREWEYEIFVVVVTAKC